MTRPELVELLIRRFKLVGLFPHTWTFEESENHVNFLLDEIFGCIMQGIVTDGVAKVTNFGVFTMTHRKDLSKSRVWLRSSNILKRAVNEKRKAMEKYAVVTDQDKTKEASNQKNCPRCGIGLEDEYVPKCQSCGTQPFESKVRTDG